jgi:hypothetical protein
MDQYTPDLLKDLEKFIQVDLKDKSMNEIGLFSKREYNPPDFLKFLDYDYKLLVKLYSLYLKKHRDTRFVQKKLRLEKSPKVDHIEYCLRSFKILIKDQSKLPLLMNKRSGLEVSIIKWRLLRGV